ncbi:MAG TPA: serine/threonine-protein kinase, partial [Labilithrix sp.]|nr:serine/threonine-protein kinase [Labilithrix sp.]
MACLSENLIVAFFSPGRSPEIAAQVDAHSAGCAACRQLLAEYALLSAGQRTAPAAPAAGPGFSGLAAAPTLTPAGSEADAGLELVQRLAQAQARKRVGTLLKGKWQIEDLLGAGGMAHVFVARHRNGRRVAIKFMRPELTLEPSLVQRFLREGYVANKIEHPGAVAILDDDVAEDGTPFLVMELLVGQTLRERLASGPLPLDEALRAIAEVLDVLAVAHDKGIVHRDLKPDNLFQTEKGEIKVLDFGIARLKEHARSEFETGSGTTLGTVGYMPPEQARGLTGEVDARTDVWAIGATLYALITGRPVHEAATVNEALLLAMTTPVPPMRSLLPRLPPAVQVLLDRALAFHKDQRYPSARAMKAALESARGAVPRRDRFSSMPPPADLDQGSPAQTAAPGGLAPSRASPTLLQRVFLRRGASSPSLAPPRSLQRRLGWAIGISAAVAWVVGMILGALSPREPAEAARPPSSLAPTPPPSHAPPGPPASAPAASADVP